MNLNFGSLFERGKSGDVQAVMRLNIKNEGNSMNASKLKGNLLEFIIRKLLLNSGFTNVPSDRLLIYNSRGLKFINGKGSSHDADVLMAPPIQMPFSYPYRLLFECKAYTHRVGLSVVRNALGLRYDINEFEIVTKAQLAQRQNNRRGNLAIDNRPRYIYQVGVASVNGFSKPAIEFAVNNKIPLISLNWILPETIARLFNEITDDFIVQINENIDNITSFLKGYDNQEGQQFIRSGDNVLSRIYNEFLNFEENILIGLLETGDLIFITMKNPENINFIRENNNLVAKFHYNENNREQWILSIQEIYNFYFHLPKRIIELWSEESFDYRTGLEIKNRFFGKIFLFVRDENLPFRIIKLDKNWLNGLQRE